MIVCGHDNERHLFHCGNVHSFLERASLHPALTDACQADKVFFTSESFRHQCAHGDRNHRAEVADHRKFVVARVTSMNVAVASTHRPEARAQIRARHINERLAERRASRLVANQWREDVAFLQKQTACHAYSFLAFADINSARDEATSIETNELFLERTRQQHPAKCLEEAIVRRRGLFCFCFCAALRRLKHLPNLREIDDRVQKNFRRSNYTGGTHCPQASGETRPCHRPVVVRQAEPPTALPARGAVVSNSVRLRSTTDLWRLVVAQSISFQPVCSRRALPLSLRKEHRLWQWCVCCG